MKKLITALFCLSFLLAQSSFAQDKSHKTAPKAPPQSIPSIATADPLENLKATLINEFENSKSYLEKSTDTSQTKHILSVKWVDADYNLIENVGHGEWISIAVLTKNYSVGDTIKITIESQDEESLMEGYNCTAVTFYGIQQYENLAVLKDIFTIEGADEKMVISNQWNKKYYCGDQ